MSLRQYVRSSKNKNVFCERGHSVFTDPMTTVFESNRETVTSTVSVVHAKLNYLNTKSQSIGSTMALPSTSVKNTSIVSLGCNCFVVGDNSERFPQ
jgi:hypothetical protein